MKKAIKFWNFKAASKDVGELMIYGDIASASWGEDEITPKLFKEELDALGEIKFLNIYINSGGGEVFAGQAIYSMLKRHAANKTVYIDGIAASIASLIAMAGDKIIMPSNAMLMIHKCWNIAMGNSDEFRQMADRMDKVDESIVGVYVDKTGKDRKEILDLLKAETWFTAEEALAAGFADEVEKEKKLAASMNGDFLNMNGQTFDLERYQNKPVVEEVIPDPLIVPPAVPPNDNGETSQPVADIGTKPEPTKPELTEQDYEHQNTLRKKIHSYKEEM